MPGKEEGLENSSGYDSTDEEVLIYSKTNVAIVRNILDTTSTRLSCHYLTHHNHMQVMGRRQGGGGRGRLRAARSEDFLNRWACW